MIGEFAALFVQWVVLNVELIVVSAVVFVISIQDNSLVEPEPIV